jgi:hypothetical protein
MADDDCDGAREAAFFIFLPDGVAVGSLGKQDAQQILLVHHVSVNAVIVDARFRIAHDGKAGGYILARILLVVGADREFIDVHVLAEDDHLLYRPGVDKDGINGISLPLGALADKLLSPPCPQGCSTLYTESVKQQWLTI